MKYKNKSFSLRDLRESAVDGCLIVLSFYVAIIILGIIAGKING